MKRSSLVVLSVVIPLVVASSAGSGEGLRLKSIMAGLGSSMERMVRAIAVEDFATVAKEAARVADHERPPMEERERIIGLLGPDATAFKAADTLVHETALRLSESASRGDTSAVARDFGVLIEGCVACHARFRSRVVDHFYGPAAD